MADISKLPRIYIKLKITQGRGSGAFDLDAHPGHPGNLASNFKPTKIFA